jgi:hypothetical protein
MNKKMSLYFIISVLNCSNSNSYNNHNTNIHFSDIAVCTGAFFLIGSCGYLLYKQVMKQYRIKKKIEKIFIEEKNNIQAIIENNMGIIALYKKIIISERQSQNAINNDNNHNNHNIIINNIVNNNLTEEHIIIKNKFLEIVYKIIKVVKNSPLFESITPEINSWLTPINIKEIIISILLDENFIIQHII